MRFFLDLSILVRYNQEQKGKKKNMNDILKALGAIIIVGFTFVYAMIIVGLSLWNHASPTLVQFLICVICVQASIIYLKIVVD